MSSPELWPSPTPEDEIRARVSRRARSMRRRVQLPAAGAALVVVTLVASVLPWSGDPQTVRTADHADESVIDQGRIDGEAEEPVTVGGRAFHDPPRSGRTWHRG